MKTVIIADSTCDMSLEDAKALSVEIVPLTVTFGSNSYKDCVEITKQEFYEKLTTSDVLPVTSQANPEDFTHVFEKHKQEGNEVVYIGVASTLSGTIQSAKIAKELIGFDDLHIVDSLSATLGIEICVRLACKLRDEGKSAKEISEIISSKVDNVKIIAMVDTLKYLIKGGRVSKTAGAIGGVLNLKPIISVKDGQIVTLCKSRGKIGAYKDMIKLVQEVEVDTDLPVVLSHSNFLQAREEFEQELKENGLKYPNATYSEIGSVIGTHTGPGCVGIAFFTK